MSEQCPDRSLFGHLATQAGRALAFLLHAGARDRGAPKCWNLEVPMPELAALFASKEETWHRFMLKTIADVRQKLPTAEVEIRNDKTATVTALPMRASVLVGFEELEEPSEWILYFEVLA